VRNVLIEKPTASEDTSLGIQWRCNVSVAIGKINPSQIMQLHESRITVCNVVKNNSIPFNSFNVHELAQSTARWSVTETAQTYRHK
jgi:hypothetical protein